MNASTTALMEICALSREFGRVNTVMMPVAASGKKSTSQARLSAFSNMFSR